MALEFQFGLHDNDPCSRAYWNAKYEKLSDMDKEFYYKQLMFILMQVDIGVVSKEAIPHIVARYRVIAPEMSDNIKVMCEEAKAEDFVEYLERFTGYQANVITSSLGAFVVKVAKELRFSMPKLSKKDAEALPLCDDILIDEMPRDDLPLLVGKQWWTSRRGAHAKYDELLQGGC